MKCLVTGMNGFAASHLIDHLLEQGHEVIGTKRVRSNDVHIMHLEGAKNLSWVLMDVTDPLGVQSVIATHKPDAIFHLAAQSFVGWSWGHPYETINTNVIGTLNVLEAVRRHVPKARVHIASSSQIYGSIPEEEQPMGLKTRFNPMNPYDTSKLSQDMLALQYFNSYKLNIVRTRAFNISGPRRGEVFAESSWAKQIALAEKAGLTEAVIKHGNLESARDYVDVRDVVKCYAHLCFYGTPGQVYILGSGNAYQMSVILSTLTSLARTKITLQVDQSRMRPSDTPFMKAGDSFLQTLIEDPIPLYRTMKDLLEYWRSKV